MDPLESINEKYKLLLTGMTDKRQYYHLRSIKNFIIHYPELSEHYYKNKTADLLNEYLDFALDKEFITQNEAKDIYYEYIDPIGDIYSKRLKFTTYSGVSTFAFNLGFLFVIFLLCNADFLFYLFAFLLAVLIFIPGYFKYKKNMVYGYDF